MPDTDTFLNDVAKVFRIITRAADTVDVDLLECDYTAEMITFVAPASGTKVIINTQRAVNQIWVAGNGEGIHFRLSDSGLWLDDKGKKIELLAWVSRCVEAACGTPLSYQSI
jgi:CyaY protein